jgi:uncharacterized membrane protein
MTQARKQTARQIARIGGRAASLAALLGCTCLVAGPAQASVNSYRFLHVTIDTPWHIFLFLLMGVFAPFILMVVLMWRNSTRKRDLARDQANKAQGAALAAAPLQSPQAPRPPEPPQA